MSLIMILKYGDQGVVGDQLSVQRVSMVIVHWLMKKELAAYTSK